jgi:hypothetical protein
MAKSYADHDPDEVVYVHADNATIDEVPFPVKTKAGYKYKPGLPGMLAICRFQVGGDLAAAAILLRLKWRWRQPKKLERFNKEWVAESRWHWAIGSGLTWHEFVKRGLPRLRKCEFVEVKPMKLRGKKSLWMHLNVIKLPAPSGPAWELYAKSMIGGHTPIGATALVGNPKDHWEA